MLEEAEKRDHRKLGRELDLFHIDEHAPGTGVLASQGLDDLAAGRAVHARGLPRQRLPGGQGPADPRQGLWEKTGPLGQVPREHVHDGVGEARLRAQADELPGPHPDLQAGHQAATATCRCATASSASATATSRRGGAARHHARARLHAGRRPHLLHRRPDPRRMRRLHGAAAEGLRRLRLHRHHLQGRDAARDSASAPTSSGTRPSTR